VAIKAGPKRLAMAVAFAFRWRCWDVNASYAVVGSKFLRSMPAEPQSSFGAHRPQHSAVVFRNRTTVLSCYTGDIAPSTGQPLFDAGTSVILADAQPTGFMLYATMPVNGNHRGAK
jgi:hypothetical protein